jgi:hypothetical protein
MDKNKVRIDEGMLLSACPSLPLGVNVPSPLKERLEALVKAANLAGAGATLKDVVSALLLDASEDGQELFEGVRRYRTSFASAAAVGSGELGDVLEFRRRPRGRRPNSGLS